jgi:hypothetical protein
LTSTWRKNTLAYLDPAKAMKKKLYNYKIYLENKHSSLLAPAKATKKKPYNFEIFFENKHSSLFRSSKSNEEKAI